MVSELSTIANFELAAFAQTRGLSGQHSDWWRIIAVAEQVLSRLADSEETEIGRLREPDLALLAATRALDAARHEKSGLPAEHRHLLGLDAALGFALAGNFPSANAVAATVFQELLSAGMDDLALKYAIPIGVIGPTTIPIVLNFLHDKRSSHATLFLSRVHDFLDSGSDEDFDQLMLQWESWAEGTVNYPHVASLALGCRPVLFQMRDLSVRRRLSPAEGLLPEFWTDSMVRSGMKLLLPSQTAVLDVEAFVRSRSNVLISTPSNTGKTLIGQFGIGFGLGRAPGLAVYVAPYRALAHQVYRELSNSIPESIAVSRAVGGYALESPQSTSGTQSIIVATPERFDSLLRHNPEMYESLRCVVFDEAHLIEQHGRGALLEGLIGRLRIQQHRGRNFRLLLLSAVISSYDKMQRWLGIPDDLAIRGTWRPTTRRLAVWSQRGNLEYYAAGDPVSRTVTQPERPMAHRTLLWPHALIPTDFIGNVRKQEPLSTANIAYLVRVLLAEGNGAVLCICATRASTRAVAHSVAADLEDRPLGETGVRIVALIERRWPHLRALRNAVRKGVAYHNASLPREILELIESATLRGEISAVVATTTLAEGIDLPFRYTVLYDWLFWDEDDQLPMSPLLFRNIAGRSGRAGSFTEGDTIIYESPLGNQQYARPGVSQSVILRTFINPPEIPLRPALTSVVEAQRGGAAMREQLGVLSSQYMAAINENPGEGELNSLYYQNLLSAQNDAQRHLRRALGDIETELISGDDGPIIAAAASPMRLTPFGQASVLTGLAASSCRQLTNSLNLLGESHGQADPSFLNELLLACHGIPELQRSVLGKVTRPRSRFLVKPEDGVDLIERWLQGVDLKLMFVSLPYVRRSKKTPVISEWVNGIDRPTSWDNEFDKFNDYVSQVLSNQLPWICRALESLKRSALHNWIRQTDWGQVARHLEHGVDTDWSVAAILEDCPVPRPTIAPYGRAAEAMTARPQSGGLFPRELQGALAVNWLGELDDLVGTGVHGDVGEEAHIQVTSWLRRRLPGALGTGP